MWNALKRYIRTLDEQGRARFMGLASDGERSAATVANVGVGAASGFALLASLYFVLYALLAVIYLRDVISNPKLWVQIYFVSLVFGLMQGSALGGIFGAGVSLKWQGKRHKAAMTALIGGAIVIALLGLFQAQYYDPAVPPEQFVFWALLLFSPGYFTAACITAWGINLLSKEKG